MAITAAAVVAAATTAATAVGTAATAVGTAAAAGATALGAGAGVAGAVGTAGTLGAYGAIGAGLGAATSAATGGDIGKGALYGGISGAAGGALGMVGGAAGGSAGGTAGGSVGELAGASSIEGTSTGAVGGMTGFTGASPGVGAAAPIGGSGLQTSRSLLSTALRPMTGSGAGGANMGARLGSISAGEPGTQSLAGLSAAGKLPAANAAVTAGQGGEYLQQAYNLANSRPGQMVSGLIQNKQSGPTAPVRPTGPAQLPPIRTETNLGQRKYSIDANGYLVRN